MHDEHAVVTGGLGFIGSHLVESLLGDGHHVTIIDNGVTGRHQNLPDDSESHLTILDHDVRESFPDIEQVDMMYHFASQASPVTFSDNPVEIAMTNSLGTRNALEFARKCDSPVVLGSSSAVYGDPEVSPQHETYTGNVSLQNERTPYDEGKRFSEALATAYNKKYGLDIRIVRPFNIYGPRMHPDDGRVVPNLVMQALSGEDLTVHGDGTQTRCFCYVSDLCVGVRSLMDIPNRSKSNLVVNLGRENKVSIRELAELIMASVDTDVSITYESERDGDPSSRHPDTTYARKLLDWSPTVDLETGIRRTIRWYQASDDRENCS